MKNGCSFFNMPSGYYVKNDIKHNTRKYKIMMACLEHGYQLTNPWNYATRNTNTDTYWVDPAIERKKKI